MSRVRDQRRAGLEAPRLDVRAALLTATERLLVTVPLHELTVAQILEEADISRGSFYSYFEPKYDLAGALLARVMDEMYELWRPYIDRDADADPEDTLRSVLSRAINLWAENRAVARMMHQYWDSVPEIGNQWVASMERFTIAVAAELERDRQDGLAPPGADSRHLAAAALWATEQLLFVAGTERSPEITRDDATFNTLMAIWSGLFYGHAQRGEP